MGSTPAALHCTAAAFTVLRSSTWIELSVIGDLLRGKIQAGKGDAARWLRLFNAAYSRKLRIPVYPGSLNLALEHTFDWFASRYQSYIIWFGREEYAGERDILMLPCELVDLGRRKAFLWTTTTAARNRPDPWVVELVCDVSIRETHGLEDGDVVALEVPADVVDQNKPDDGVSSA